MADPFIGEVKLWGLNFAPFGFAFCNGQLLPIVQNTALFAILGTQYGGDGKTNFALPNLQDRVVMGAGAGPGLTPRPVGTSDGAATVTLLDTQVPPHGHALRTINSRTAGTVKIPVEGKSMFAEAATEVYGTGGSATAVLAAPEIDAQGGGQAHENRMPWLALNFCIALSGIFPPRS